MYLSNHHPYKSLFTLLSTANIKSSCFIFTWYITKQNVEISALQGTSNEYPQHMCSWRNKKNIMWITSLILSYGNYTNQHFSVKTLTLKMPRKPASENVVCLCRLLNILANFSNLFLHYRQTVWTQIRLLLKEQSDLGPHCLQKWLLK